MERGHIRITENDRHEFSVEAKLINGTLWLSTWEMADLFNVYTKTIEGSLKTIFKAGLFRENEVSRKHTFVKEGRKCETILYNLDVLVAVSYRIASFEAQAFRNWLMKALTEYARDNKKQKREVLVIYNTGKGFPSITSLN